MGEYLTKGGADAYGCGGSVLVVASINADRLVLVDYGSGLA